MAKGLRKKPVQLDLFGHPIEEKKPGIGLILADFHSLTVRLVFIKGEPWWVLADVARVLGYRDATNAGRLLRDKHKGTHLVSTPGGDQPMTVINEAGLYRLMMRSDHPEAEAFQDWVTDEVLPSIRRTGTYTQKGGRIERLTKKVRTADPGVLLPRIDQVTKNKEINGRLASQGACPREFQAIHNACYRGQIGDEAKAIRARLNLKGHETPLNHMGSLPLAQNLHTKALAEHQIRDAGRPLSSEEQCQIFEETARHVAQSDFAKLGFEFVYGVIDDACRGKIIDVVRKAIEAK